jgi:hypothetical protein
LIFAWSMTKLSLSFQRTIEKIKLIFSNVFLSRSNISFSNIQVFSNKLNHIFHRLSTFEAYLFAFYEQNYLRHFPNRDSCPVNSSIYRSSFNNSFQLLGYLNIFRNKILAVFTPISIKFNKPSALLDFSEVCFVEKFYLWVFLIKI